MNPTTIGLALKLGKKAWNTVRDRREEKAAKLYDEFDELKKKAATKGEELVGSSKKLCEKVDTVAGKAVGAARDLEEQGSTTVAEAVEKGKKTFETVAAASKKNNKRRCCRCRKAKKVAAAVAAASKKTTDIDADAVKKLAETGKQFVGEKAKRTKKDSSSGLFKFVSFVAFATGVVVSIYWWFGRKDDNNTPMQPPRVEDHATFNVDRHAETLGDLGDKASDIAETVVDTAEDVADKAKGKAEDLVESVDDADDLEINILTDNELDEKVAFTGDDDAHPQGPRHARRDK